MKFRSAWLIAVVMGLSLVVLAVPAAAAGPKEVKAKTQKAAKFLAEKGDAAVAEMNKGVKWRAEPYIFALDYKGVFLVHPSPALVGRSMANFKDAKGNLLLAVMKKAAEAKGHGWSEYWSPKPGAMKPSRKVSYFMKVPGKDWLVGCGTFGYTKAQAIKEAGE